jgi:hypothetical protein
MKKRFIESLGFTAWLTENLADEDYAAFQNQLLEDPEGGDVIKGCGGLRKIRLADPKRKKGKRGGARVIYLHVPEADWIFLIDVYGKDEKDDLSANEKRELRRLAALFREEAVRATGADGGNDK